MNMYRELISTKEALEMMPASAINALAHEDIVKAIGDLLIEEVDEK